MGVWSRSILGRDLNRNNSWLLGECREIIPHLEPEDIIGSAFSISSYNVDPMLGGNDALIYSRDLLHSHGKQLILDFISNHVGLDHEWLPNHPDWFIQGSEEELATYPKNFIQIEGNIFAHGRDPYFDPWTDTIQINAFSPELRRAYIDTLCQIAEWCDGVRCDMAQLLSSRIFQKTWNEKASAPLEQEFWIEIISTVKQQHPDFKFIAEVYWDMERELQERVLIGVTIKDFMII